MTKREFTSFGLEPLHNATGRITKKIFKASEGFLSSLVLDWALVVGDTFSKNLSPKKVTFPRGKNKEGTLHLETNSGSQSLIAYHMQAFILQKVNRFFGHDAFAKITITQTKNQVRTSPATRVPSTYRLSQEDQDKIRIQTKNVPGDDLKEALQKLGEALIRKDQNHEQ